MVLFMQRSSEICPQHGLTDFICYQVVEDGEQKQRKECTKCLELYEFQRNLMEDW